MRHAIRHHGVAVADAAGDIAVARQGGGGLLRTGGVERRLVRLAGYRADLTRRAGLPHPPDLHAGTPRFATRARLAARTRSALRSGHALRALRSGQAGLAARASWTLRPLRSCHARHPLRSARALQPLQPLQPLWTGGARRSRLAARPARTAVGYNGLALGIAGFERHGAIRRVVGEAKREAAALVAA